MMKKMSYLIAFLLIVNTAAASVVIATGHNKIDKTEQKTISTCNGGRKVTVQIKKNRKFGPAIAMWDPIDLTPCTYCADFTVKITVEGDTWTCKAPDDLETVSCDQLDNNGKHTWNVGDKDKVDIRVKLIDRDLISDDVCDINGRYSSERDDRKDVEFTYDLWNTGCHKFFDGTGDGSLGSNLSEDEDDAMLTLRVKDSFNPKPELTVTKHRLNWDLEFDRSESIIVNPKHFRIKNTGHRSTTLKYEIKGIDDWYTVSNKKGEIPEHDEDGRRVYIDPDDKELSKSDSFTITCKGISDKAIIDVDANVVRSKAKNNEENTNNEQSQEENIFKFFNRQPLFNFFQPQKKNKNLFHQVFNNFNQQKNNFFSNPVKNVFQNINMSTTDQQNPEANQNQQNDNSSEQTEDSTPDLS